MSTDASEREDSKVRGFPCSACGADLTYSPGSTKLKCPYCGHENDIQSRPALAVEHDLEELTLSAATTNKGFGLETRTFRCENCSATTTFPAGVTSTKCAFCGNPIVVQTPSNPNLVRPETLIPFQLDKPCAISKFRSWIKSLWFRPNKLKQMAALSDMTGIYAPFFTFDASADSDWTGEAGFYYYESEQYYDSNDKQWKTRQVQKVRWEWHQGHHEAFYDDELICASRGMPGHLMDRMYPFELQHLVPYREEFLAGWSAEEYSIEPRELWTAVQNMLEDHERDACSEQLGGDTQRNLSVQTQFSNIRWKHVLLPIYIAAYRYGGKVYRVVVNGQTGAVAGEAPLSWWKIIGLIALIILIVALVRFFSASR